MENPIRMSTQEECRSTCIAKPACKFFSFRNGNECLLMKTKGNVNPNGGVVVIFVLVAVVILAEVAAVVGFRPRILNMNFLRQF